MTNFRIISSALVLLASVLTSACKVGWFIITDDDSGPISHTTMVPAAGLASPGKVGWFINTRDDDASTIDSLISSNIHELSYEEGFRVIGYNCIKLLCRNSETEESHDLGKRWRTPIQANNREEKLDYVADRWVSGSNDLILFLNGLHGAS